MTDQKPLSTEYVYIGTAYGSDPNTHHIVGGRFVCSAPADAKCRTSPTCECENWCGCDGSPQDAADNHDEGDHCCMTTVKAGQGCWIEPWVDAAGGVEDTGNSDEFLYDDDGEVAIPDGPVACDWDDGIQWSYAEPSDNPTPPGEQATRHSDVDQRVLTDDDTEKVQQFVIEAVAEGLVLTDVLTPNHDGTPEHYTVHADDVEYLVKTVLDFAASVREQMSTPPATNDHHVHEWEVEYLPDPMSAGSVVRSGDLFCTCGQTVPDVSPSPEQTIGDSS